MKETTARVVPSTATNSQQTVIGQTVVLRGELSANEDLLIEGQFEGTIALEDHRLTVGSDGQVKAEIHARNVVILGSVSGNIVAREKVEIRHTGHIVGDLKASAVIIEEGAFIKGSIDIHRDEDQEGSGTSPQAASETASLDLDRTS